MKYLKPPVVLLLVLGPLVFSCAEMKQAGRDIGHATRDVTKKIGHGTRDVTRKIGHGTRDAVKTVGHGTRDAVKEVGSKMSDAETSDSNRTGPPSK